VDESTLLPRGDLTPAAGGGVRLTAGPLLRTSYLSAVVTLVPAVLGFALATARAEIVTGDNIQVNFQTSISPKALPRHSEAPVSLRVDGKISPLGPGTPAGLSRVVIQVNRHASFTTRGLPRCRPKKLRGTSSRRALAVCGDALIGSGFITSHIDFPGNAPFPAKGRVLAFNSTKDGHQALAVHVFGREPASISTVLSGALVPRGPSRGQYGPRVVIDIPEVEEGWGYVDGFGLTFHRRFRYRGEETSVVSATCPAPADLREVPFKAARGVFELTDGQVLTRSVGGSCRAMRDR
jgi:hypothetical protein